MSARHKQGHQGIVNVRCPYCATATGETAADGFVDCRGCGLPWVRMARAPDVRARRGAIEECRMPNEAQLVVVDTGAAAAEGRAAA